MDPLGKSLSPFWARAPIGEGVLAAPNGKAHHRTLIRATAPVVPYLCFCIPSGCFPIPVENGKAPQRALVLIGVRTLRRERRLKKQSYNTYSSFEQSLKPFFLEQGLKKKSFVNFLSKNIALKKISSFKPIEYSLDHFHRSNQDTCLIHRTAVTEGEWVQSGDLLADCSASVGGELALGHNIVVAYMPWEGFNYEDAILLSERLVFDDVYTSIHIERYGIETRETKTGKELITRKIPDVSEKELKRLDKNGIAKLGSWVEEGDILVGKITPISQNIVSDYQKLLVKLFEKELKSVKDTSLRAPKGIKSKVIKIQVLKYKSQLEDNLQKNRGIVSSKFSDKIPKAKQLKRIRGEVLLPKKINNISEEQSFWSLPISGSLPVENRKEAKLEDLTASRGMRFHSIPFLPKFEQQTLGSPFPSRIAFLPFAGREREGLLPQKRKETWKGTEQTKWKQLTPLFKQKPIDRKPYLKGTGRFATIGSTLTVPSFAFPIGAIEAVPDRKSSLKKALALTRVKTPFLFWDKSLSQGNKPDRGKGVHMQRGVRWPPSSPIGERDFLNGSIEGAKTQRGKTKKPSGYVSFDEIQLASRLPWVATLSGSSEKKLTEQLEAIRLPESMKKINYEKNKLTLSLNQVQFLSNKNKLKQKRKHKQKSVSIFTKKSSWAFARKNILFFLRNKKAEKKNMTIKSFKLVPKVTRQTTDINKNSVEIFSLAVPFHGFPLSRSLSLLGQNPLSLTFPEAQQRGGGKEKPPRTLIRVLTPKGARVPVIPSFRKESEMIKTVSKETQFSNSNISLHSEFLNAITSSTKDPGEKGSCPLQGKNPFRKKRVRKQNASLYRVFIATLEKYRFDRKEASFFFPVVPYCEKARAPEGAGERGFDGHPLSGFLPQKGQEPQLSLKGKRELFPCEGVANALLISATLPTPKERLTLPKALHNLDLQGGLTKPLSGQESNTVIFLEDSHPSTKRRGLGSFGKKVTYEKRIKAQKDKKILKQRILRYEWITNPFSVSFFSKKPFSNDDHIKTNCLLPQDGVGLNDWPTLKEAFFRILKSTTMWNENLFPAALVRYGRPIPIPFLNENGVGNRLLLQKGKGIRAHKLSLFRALDPIEVKRAKTLKVKTKGIGKKWFIKQKQKRFINKFVYPATRFIEQNRILSIRIKSKNHKRLSLLNLTSHFYLNYSKNLEKRALTFKTLAREIKKEKLFLRDESIKGLVSSNSHSSVSPMIPYRERAVALKKQEYLSLGNKGQKPIPYPVLIKEGNGKETLARGFLPFPVREQERQEPFAPQRKGDGSGRKEAFKAPKVVITLRDPAEQIRQAKNVFDSLKLVKKNLKKSFFPWKTKNLLEKKSKLKKIPTNIHIYLAEKRKIQVGDKMAGRHGNKGIISLILPRQDMPFLPDGTPIDIVLNPLGVPSRMNVGQIYECLLGLAGKYLGEQYKIFPFDEIYGPEASRSFVYSKLYEARKKTGFKWLFDPSFPGKIRIYDGRTGESFDQSITVGRSYILKLVHMVDDKIHSRSTGPYSLVTQQPLRGRSKMGGQRLGEMEVWAIEGYGAAFTLLEMLTIKSDDMNARQTLWSSIIFNKEISIGTPEAFNVLVRELQALCLDMGLFYY
jgi:DNA-directed RNA polymerase subunit beta